MFLSGLGPAILNRSSPPVQRRNTLMRSSTTPSALSAQLFRMPESLLIAPSTNFSISPAILSLRCITSTEINASPMFEALCLSCCLTRCSAGRRLMRAAAMLGGAGMMPIRLMPRLTQARKSTASFLMNRPLIRTMSMITSINAMMLPMTGRLPATVLKRSSVT
ncbi:hypothetical protein D3C72_1273120 [compost metagenome]